MNSEVYVSLVELMEMKNSVEIQACGEHHPEELRHKLSILLKDNERIYMDFAGLKSLSPSFAYEAFGKLVDQMGLSVANRIVARNDERQLFSRISEAFARRNRVVHRGS